VLPKFLRPYNVKKSNLIRIGPRKDGGYIIDKRILGKSKVLISCGLNDDWGFEKDFLKKNGNISILAYDHTVNNKFWYKRFKKDILSLLLFKKIKFDKIIDVFKYLDYKLFFRNSRIHYQKKIVSRKRNDKEITISNILNNYKKNVILKIDIEGDEYKIFKDIKKNSKKILFLILELHNVNKNINKIKNFLKGLDLKIIHMHGNNYGGIDEQNNPKVIELSLLNSKNIKILNIHSKSIYPITGLDYKNLKRKDDIKIKFNN
tara:strand:+ start:1491 stop:2273 length:783 start_codon:yes stop_codon:yes gene_type:complete